jgi:hypothetical protein
LDAYKSREETMKTKNTAIMILALLMLSSFTLLTTAVLASPSWPKLPSTTVQLTAVTYGPDSFFISTLSGVPGGFDVYNGVYRGWCAQTSVIMTEASHDVKLYSSISPPVLTSINWVAINYILNHKQGDMTDIQRLIWYFTDGILPTDPGYNPPSSAFVQAMIDAANANPTYDPTTGEILAIICLPQNDPNAQNSFIELQKPGTGKVTGGGQCIVGENTEIPSASFGFNAMWFSRNPTPNGEINYIDHITGQHVHVHDLTYLEVWQDEPGNKPWPMLKAKFGGLDVYSGLMVDVYVEDHGEPGKNDKFLIFLDGEYLGGSGDYFGSALTNDPILAGNIQIHKPPA